MRRPLVHPLALFTLLLASTLAPAVTATEKGPRLVAPDESGSPFLLRETRVEAIVTGPVARTEVRQTWENPNTRPVHGIYVFPLPENAAVTDMTLRIGSRVIRSEMKRREEARQIYEQARAEGRVAGLLEQEPPNIFVQQVANIVPGERIEVVLELDHEVKCQDGDCEYVFPTVVGPRFVPARQTDPGRITPPVAAPGVPTGQIFTLKLDLNAGVSIRSIECPSHRVTIARARDDRAHVELSANEAAKLDRDFRLRWKVGGDAPEAAVLAWRDPLSPGEPGVFTLIVQPPDEVEDREAAPRELFFVLDCSGSMSGVPIEAAKNVVRKALAAVRPQDTFQIVRFSDRASELSPTPLRPTPEKIRRALAYLDQLQGEGGTEMISGIRAALDAPPDPERLRIVAFLTDGYIGNEGEILAEVRRKLGDARLFSFGIGSSVNRYLLESLAEEGRGQAAFLAPRESPEQMVERFVRRIATPVLTDLRLTFRDVDVLDLEPETIPDLFLGQPLVVHGGYRAPGTGVVTIEGFQRGRPVTIREVMRLPERAADHEALGRLWARARIHRLERSLHDGDRPETREEIVKLGLRHRLMTAWTSLVAVDSVVSNPGGQGSEMEVPVEMPQDVSYEGVFGGGTVQAALVRSGVPPASSPVPSQLVSLGYVARKDHAKTRPVPAAEVKDEDRADESVHDAAFRAIVTAFTKLAWIKADGTRLEIEASGEVWRTGSGGRSKVRTLRPDELEKLLAALAAVPATTWDRRARGERIEVETPAGPRALALRGASPSMARLVALLRSWEGA